MENPTDPDSLLKDRLAEGAKGPNLQRDLFRLNAERPSLKFHELRKKAVDWLSHDQRGEHIVAKHEGVSTSDLMHVIQEQSQLVKDMREAMKEMQAGRSDDKKACDVGQGNPRKEHAQDKTCNYCKKPGHIIRACRKLKDKKQCEAQQEAKDKKPQSKHSDAKHLNP